VRFSPLGVKNSPLSTPRALLWTRSLTHGLRLADSDKMRRSSAAALRERGDNLSSPAVPSHRETRDEAWGVDFGSDLRIWRTFPDAAPVRDRHPRGQFTRNLDIDGDGLGYDQRRIDCRGDRERVVHHEAAGAISLLHQIEIVAGGVLQEAQQLGRVARARRDRLRTAASSA
jgi:hypothetical protein